MIIQYRNHNYLHDGDTIQPIEDDRRIDVVVGKFYSASMLSGPRYYPDFGFNSISKAYQFYNYSPGIFLNYESPYNASEKINHIFSKYSFEFVDTSGCYKIRNHKQEFISSGSKWWLRRIVYLLNVCTDMQYLKLTSVNISGLRNPNLQNVRNC